jgi:hypothetical protein
MKDVLIEAIGQHIGDEWLGRLIADAKKEFAKKGALIWFPKMNNTLFELCEHEGQGAYLLRFFAGAFDRDNPIVFSAVIAVEKTVQRRNQRQLYN